MFATGGTKMRKISLYSLVSQEVKLLARYHQYNIEEGSFPSALLPHFPTDGDASFSCS